MAVILAFALNASTSVLLGLLVAGLRGPADFGRFALATAGSIVLNTLLFEWLRLSATRFYSGRTREEAPWIRYGLDRAYLALALVLFAAAMICAGLGIEAGAGSRGAMLAGTALAGLGSGIFDYHLALARARFEGRLYLGLTMLKSLASVALMAGAAWFLREPAWVLAAAGVSQLLAVLLLKTPLRDPRRPVPPERLRETWRLFTAYGLPLIAATAIYQLLPFLNRWALSGWADFAEAGYFALAGDIAGRSLGTLGIALDLLLFQLAVRAEERHGRAEAEAQVARNAAVLAAVLLPCAVGFWVVLPAVEALVVPEAYRGPFAAYAALLIPGFLVLALTSFALSPVFQIRRRTGPVVAAALVGLGLDGLGLALLPPLLGAHGVALAQTVALAGAFLWLALRVLRGPERLRLPWREIGAAAAASLAMGLVLLPFRGLAPSLTLAVCLPLGVLLYGALVWRFDVAGLRGMARAEVRALRRVPRAS